jgi:pSer/pThr/pTyr-binding forkhead associated (FHA) protein
MKLVCIEGENKNHSWQVMGRRSVIGRDPDCDIVIEDPMLSRVHAEVVYDGGSFIFRDHGSLNGSNINNVRVTSHVLLPEDVIKLGDTTLKVVEEDLSQEICWQEHDPFVTREISLDHLTERGKELASEAKKGKGKRRQNTETNGLNAAKLIKNLEKIYEVGKTLNSIRNLDEMVGQIG